MKKTTNIFNFSLFFILSVVLSACGGGGGSGESSAGNADPIEKFSIETNVTPSMAGSVSGAGEYPQGSTFNLEAEANSGYIFAGWKEDGITISNQPSLEAEASENRSFTAEFVENTIQEIKLSPTDSQIPLYTDLTLTAQAIYSDGASRDVSQSVAWTTSDLSKADFSNSTPNLLESKAEGMVTIGASIDGVSSATIVTISSPELLSLILSKESLELALGETDSVQVEGEYRGEVVIDVTKDVQWSSANEGVAVVSNLATDAVTVKSNAVGSTEISAQLDGITTSATVTVGEAALRSIAISTESTNIFEGSVSQLTSSATYTDGSSSDVTEQVTWQSSVPSVVSVSDAAPTKGLVSALAEGASTITAQLGDLTVESPLSVVAAPNMPGALTLQATPNVILNDSSDESLITATVLPNDETNGVIADGTVVELTRSSNDLTLSSAQGGTVSGEVTSNATSSTAGQFDIIGEVPETVAIDEVGLRVVSSFSTVIGVSSSTGLVNINGFIQAGSTFSATITNTSNRVFEINQVLFFNGSMEVTSTSDPSVLGGGTLEAGESVGVTITLNSSMRNDGFLMIYELSDTPTASQFVVQKAF
ncbi:Ig-like domain-containing protein [Marinobacter sp.]|uniref:Ig-like domain-containing protein n=1 Tax=Marinobacter sp. TaxID=50741 RepID=UPI001B6CC1F3|nr:Ig-like domain-containing protein [Marinobacter sp.]MBQ0831986.1 Ig-like domain-containing protein [Marinobacter sp.]